jgi:NCAIR mutase (PurE)-related protein
LRYYPEARILSFSSSSSSAAGGGEETTTPPDQAAMARPPIIGRIGVLSAGTCDLPVAEEAAVTAELFGLEVERIYDVGVAGLHRLLDPSTRKAMDSADLLVVVAGMDGALPR